jgi:hypothetical protein
MEPYLVVLLTIVGVVVAKALFLLALSGGDRGRLVTACSAFFRLLRDEAFAKQVQPLLIPGKPAEEIPAKQSGAPLRVLSLLQRQGRLLDFLLEDIQGYQDAQVGAAVRDIHRQCQAALKEHLVLQPVVEKKEGESVNVPVGFDPAAIRVIGNVTGEPPYQGVLQHHGWRVKEIKLTPPPAGQDEFVLQPAEVEIQ